MKIFNYEPWCWVAFVAILLLSCCSSVRVDDSIAGCPQIDGKARDGNLSQYDAGEGTGW